MRHGRVRVESFADLMLLLFLTATATVHCCFVIATATVTVIVVGFAIFRLTATVMQRSSLAIEKTCIIQCNYRQVANTFSLKL